MAATTGISWTDATFNPWIGCTRVSPACKFCYAEADFDKRRGHAKWGNAGTRIITSGVYWKQPLKWNRDAVKEGVRKRVFCASLADVFEDWQGPIRDSKGRVLGKDYEPADSPEMHNGDLLTMGDVRTRLFALIDATPHLDWQILTKRPENILRMINLIRLDGGTTGRIPEFDIDTPAHPYFRRNVWLGTSVENQEWANKRIPHLMDCRDLTPVLFLSCEPLLGRVDLTDIDGKIGIGLHSYDVLNGRNHHWDDGGQWTPCDKVDWVITGGESGSNARPMKPEWVREIRDDCEMAGVAFFHKQNGEFLHVDDAIANKLTNTYDGRFDPYDSSLGVPMVRVGKKAAGRELDGKIHDGFPVVK